MSRRVVSAREQVDMLSPWRTAMPKPMPFGMTFHYHPTDDTVPSDLRVNHEYSHDRKGRPLKTPAVVARHNGEYAGHLEWNPADHEMPVPVVDEIYVAKKHRRKGIATALFDFARHHENDLEHSNDRSELGDKWVQYETGEREGRDGEFRTHEPIEQRPTEPDPDAVKTWWNPHEDTRTPGLMAWPDDLRHYVTNSVRRETHPQLSYQEVGELNKHIPYEAGRAAAQHPAFAGHDSPSEAFKSFWHWDDGRGAGAIGGIVGDGFYTTMGPDFYQGWHDARTNRSES